MEAGKRKRAPTADGAARERKSARRDSPPPAVDDAEVDEFFAILRRMREASSKCRAPAAAAAARANGAIRLSGEDGLTWKPAFVWEDFEGYAGAVVSGDDDKAEDGNRRSLDLNADPEPEGR